MSEQVKTEIMDKREKIKAVAMISGGLDSTLAAKIIKDQGIEVHGINFNTGFCLTDFRSQVPNPKKPGQIVRNEALRAGSDIRFPVEIIDISQEYVGAVVTKPKYGYGSAMNPCIDCRIFMFKRAKKYMDEVGAKFIFTGEVLKQRPMTQFARTLKLIETESGLERLILRPLSARLLPITIPEERGWVNREKLLDIEGRQRIRQMHLADVLQIGEYPTPAGGCCSLVDKNFGRRIKDVMNNEGLESTNQTDLVLLKVGRHFRLPDGTKVIVGRNEAENNFLKRYKNGYWTFESRDFMGPVVLSHNESGELDMEAAAALTARYCDGKTQDLVIVNYDHDDDHGEISVSPASEEFVTKYRL